MPLQQPDDFLYDVRLIDRHLARGLIKREDLEKRRSASPDMVDQADAIDLDQLGSAINARTGAKKP